MGAATIKSTWVLGPANEVETIHNESYIGTRVWNKHDYGEGKKET